MQMQFADMRRGDLVKRRLITGSCSIQRRSAHLGIVPRADRSVSRGGGV
jgi:hypothetical protein